MKTIRAVDNALVKVQRLMLIICTLAMVALIIWQVVARYVLQMSVPYAEELARLAIVWCIFIGSALAVRFDDHAKMDMILRKLPHGIFVVVQSVIDLAVAAMACVWVYYGYIITVGAWGDRTTSLQYPYAVFYLPAVLAGVLIVVYSITNIVKNVFFPVEKQETAKEE